MFYKTMDKRAGNFKDLTGKRFGRLFVIKFVYVKKGNAHFLCKCDCGNTKVINSYILQNWSKSCGCFYLNNKTHKLSRTKFYTIWRGIRARCFNELNPAYKNYGGRGIIVCDRWLSFINFRDDMFVSYKEHILNNEYTSLDRIDNNGNYELKNCKWSTREEQQNNTRHNHLLTYKGQTLNTTQWTKKLKLKNNVLRLRLNIGWSVERAITTPANVYNKKEQN